VKIPLLPHSLEDSLSSTAAEGNDDVLWALLLQYIQHA
jgi:hypothetical protein